MIILTLEEIKMHLRFPDTDTDAEQDPCLEGLEAAAVDYVSDYLNAAIPYEADSSHSDPWIPAAVRHGLLILIADMFENREENVIGASVQAISTVKDMLHMKRVDIGI